MDWRRPPSVRTRVVALAAAAAACLALPAWRLGRGFVRVEVAGGSMTPELHPGDFLLLRRGAPARDRAYGRIVMTDDPRPEGAGRLLLKRIVGLPGEALRVGGGVQVNGRRLIEPYAHGADPIDQHRGVQRLAEDTYFLLGDHRAHSTDSRDFGPVARERITATALLRYWPPRRIGRLVPPERRFLGPAETPEAAHVAHGHGRLEHAPPEPGAPVPDAGSS